MLINSIEHFGMVKKMPESNKNKKHTGCKSWLCKQCKHYIKFLTVSTMQGICWNKGCFYESKDEIQPLNSADGESTAAD